MFSSYGATSILFYTYIKSQEGNKNHSYEYTTWNSKCYKRECEGKMFLCISQSSFVARRQTETHTGSLWSKLDSIPSVCSASARFPLYDSWFLLQTTWHAGLHSIWMSILHTFRYQFKQLSMGQLPLVVNWRKCNTMSSFWAHRLAKPAILSLALRCFPLQTYFQKWLNLREITYITNRGTGGKLHSAKSFLCWDLGQHF